MQPFVRNKPYKGTVQGIVFDWAGTAVDYGCIGPVAVFLKVFKKRGVEVTIDEARAPMGLMKKDHIRAMCELPSVAARWEQIHGRPPVEQDVESMYAMTEPMMVNSIADHSEPIPGTIETIEELRKRQIKIGTSTGYTRAMVEVLAKEATAKGYVPDAVVCSSDVPAGRPYPWMCYQNAIMLQVYPMESMVKIGDTVSDIQEGLNAGMWTVGVTKTGNELGLTEAQVNAMPQEDLYFRLSKIAEKFSQAGAHYVIQSIRDCVGIIDRIEERLARGERP